MPSDDDALQKLKNSYEAMRFIVSKFPAEALDAEQKALTDALMRWFESQEIRAGDLLITCAAIVGLSINLTSFNEKGPNRDLENLKLGAFFILTRFFAQLETPASDKQSS